MKHVVTISATMEGVGPIGPKDQVFLLVKRMSQTGDVMSREQYKAKSVEICDFEEVVDIFQPANDELDPRDATPISVDSIEYAERLRNAPDIVVEYPED